MPRSSAAAIAIVDIFLIPLGAVCVAAGVVAASRYAELRWMGALLVVLGLLVLAEAVRGLFAWGRAVRADEATEQAMRAAVADRAASAGPAAPVLAHWTYGADEWREFASSEIRFRTREALGMGVATLALGTVVIAFLERNLATAAIISGATGAFIALWRWAMAFAAYRHHRAAPTGEVIIGPTALLVNRRYDAIHDANVRFRGARVVGSGRGAVLEIQIFVPGKYRHTVEEYRIPIPRGREEEASVVAARLLSVRFGAAHA